MELGNMIFGNSGGSYPVDRSWQEAFVTKLYDMKFDGYGIPEEDERNYKGKFNTMKSELGSITYFENDTFIIMPYYWGDDDTIAEMFNFVHKSSGFTLSWYKYALRDSYMNKDITFEELMSIMEDCKKSLGFDDVPYHYQKAIEHLNSAVDTLFCADAEQKSIAIYNKIELIINELKEGY